MEQKERRAFYCDCVLPVILGNQNKAHALAGRLFAKYGVWSIICDRHIRLLNVLNFKCGFLQLSNPQEQRLTVEQLKSLAEERTEYILILVPTNEYYAEFLRNNRSALESEFIIVNSPSELDTLSIFSPSSNTIY